ncbi:hypothetical protein D9M71_681170 [compost metagenome]
MRGARTTQKPYARISVIPVSTRNLGKERLYAAESNYDPELQKFQAPRRGPGTARGGTGREQGGQDQFAVRPTDNPGPHPA